jgi:CheY-like chemotaxis protein
MHEPVNILVVDDLPTQRLTIEAALAQLGEHIISVGSGREALKFLLDHDAAVVLLDVNMPEMDGFETATLIRQRPRNVDTPIIFLTADTDEMQAARGYALGAVDYLFCPFPPEILRTKVEVFARLWRGNERVKREAEQQIELSREQSARAAAEEQSRRLRVLLDASDVLQRSIDGSEFEEALLALFVPLIADEAGIVFTDEPTPRSSVWAHADGAAAPKFSAHRPAALRDALARTMKSGAETELPDPAGRGTAGLLTALTAGREIYGVLAMSVLPSARRYSDSDLELIRLLASRISVALDQRRLYRELQERDRKKDEFLAMLSHELRNPLGAITTAVRVLEMVRGPDDRALQARQVIARQSFHLARMVDDLLEVSRVTTGRIALTRGPLDLCEIVGHAVESLRTAGRLDHHDLSFTGEAVMIDADAARTEQIVTNLLVNAVKYTDPGGRIRVEVAAEDEHAVLTVRDNGIGIAPDLLPRLFEVFVQGRRTLDRAEGGLGIGLTLVKRLVELQGGTVGVKSPGQGQGSTFVVRLPRIHAERPIREETVEAPPTLPPLRVLVVEDNKDAREMLRTYLELDGHQVHEAANGPEAVEQALRLQPDVALLDLGLPGFDGLEVARRLRGERKTREILLIALTGYGQAADQLRTSELGFDSHLVKPVSPNQLTEALAGVLKRNAANAGLESAP